MYGNKNALQETLLWFLSQISLPSGQVQAYRGDPLRILVVDDNEAIRRGLRLLLSARPDWTVCGEAENGLDAIDKAKSLHPDVAVMDVSMPGMDGFEATKRIRRLVPKCQVVIISQNDAGLVGKQAAAVGASGFVSKMDVTGSLVTTIDEVVRDRFVPNDGDQAKMKMATAVDLVERKDPESSGSPSASVAGRSFEKALFESGPIAVHLMAAIVGSSDDAIISKNLDGVITSWNKGAERIFGYTAEEAIGKHITLIIPPEYRQEEARIIEKLKKGERVDHFETMRMSKDGTQKVVSLTISPVKDGFGRVIGASKVARDISEQKRAERELRESREQLRLLAEDLETKVRIRTQELEQRNAEVLQQSDQLRELSSRLLRTQDEERRRIARELHDSVGQIVTVLAMNFSSMESHAELDPRVSKVLQESQDLIAQLSRETRTLSYLLHPPLLDETGLSRAIEWYIQGLAERSDLKVQFDISDGFGRLSNELELAVFRIVQESLTNIHRHSESKTATIVLSRDEVGVAMVIEDEGKGMTPEKLAGVRAQRSGVGITGMRERVRQLGGVLDIQSSEKGTKVSVTFPATFANPRVAVMEEEDIQAQSA